MHAPSVEPTHGSYQCIRSFVLAPASSAGFTLLSYSRPRNDFAHMWVGATEGARR